MGEVWCVLGGGWSQPPTQQSPQSSATRHENHTRCCVSVFLYGSDSRFKFGLLTSVNFDHELEKMAPQTVLCFGTKIGAFCGQGFSGLWPLGTKQFFCDQEFFESWPSISCAFVTPVCPFWLHSETCSQVGALC